MEAVKNVEPELYKVCVPECVYRCGCSELNPCGFFKRFIGHCQEISDLLDIKNRYNLYHKFKEGEKTFE